MTIHKRERIENCEPSNNESNQGRRKKFKIVSKEEHVETTASVQKNKKAVPEDRGELLKLIRGSLPKIQYKNFLSSVQIYQKSHNLNDLFKSLVEIFSDPELTYILNGMHRFLYDNHKTIFNDLLQNM